MEIARKRGRKIKKGYLRWLCGGLAALMLSGCAAGTPAEEEGTVSRGEGDSTLTGQELSLEPTPTPTLMPTPTPGVVPQPDLAKFRFDEDWGLEGYYGLKHQVDIPKGVTSIGDGAFLWRDNLESVTIPKSVTSIEWDAFGDSLMIIYGEAGSYAEQYAQEHGIEFIAQ